MTGKLFVAIVCWYFLGAVVVIVLELLQWAAAGIVNFIGQELKKLKGVKKS